MNKSIFKVFIAILLFILLIPQSAFATTGSLSIENPFKEEKGLVKIQSGQAFSDVPETHRFHEEIIYLSSKKIINGFNPTTFKPEGYVTRAAAAAMIGRSLGLDGTKRVTKFADVGSSSFASGYIDSAVQEGIIQGYGDNTFRPNKIVTRAEMALFLQRAFTFTDEAAFEFTDVYPSAAAYEAIHTLAAAGVAGGYEDGTFRPSLQLTRAQFSAFLARALNEDFRLEVLTYFDAEIIDSVHDPVQPILYFIDAASNTLVAFNHETDEYIDLPFDRPLEAMTFKNGKLYVTLLHGSHSSYWWEDEQEGELAVIDAETFSLINRFTVNIDPFDIEVDSNGIIYVSSGSGQWTVLQSYNESGVFIDEDTSIYEKSRIKLHPSEKKLYALTKSLSPADLEAYTIDNGTFVSTKDSPYHGDYQLSAQFSFTPDGSFIFNGTGNIFRATLNDSTDLTYYGKITPGFTDIAFHEKSGQIITSSQRTESVSYLNVYDYNTFVSFGSVEIPGVVKRVFFYEDTLAVLIELYPMGSNRPYMTVITESIE